MREFNLPDNFTDNPDRIGKRKKPASSKVQSAVEPANSAPPSTSTNSMAQKTLRDYSVPAVANVPTRPIVNAGDGGFELRTGLITMVQANPFCGLPSEDANIHLQHFLELCETVVIKDVAPDTVKLRLFPFSLVGKAKQ